MYITTARHVNHIKSNKSVFFIPNPPHKNLQDFLVLLLPFSSSDAEKNSGRATDMSLATIRLVASFRFAGSARETASHEYGLANGTKSSWDLSTVGMYRVVCAEPPPVEIITILFGFLYWPVAQHNVLQSCHHYLWNPCWEKIWIPHPFLCHRRPSMLKRSESALAISLSFDIEG